VSVIGELFRDAPPVFGEYRRRLDDRIDHWGFQATRDAYRAALLAADVFVSTAKHEFFGITAVEAMAAGCFPLLPRRLTYPELLQGVNDPDSFLYDGTARDLARRLRRLARRIDTDQRLDDQLGNVRWAMRRYDWDRRASEMDARLESVSSLIQRP